MTNGFCSSVFFILNNFKYYSISPFKKTCLVLFQHLKYLYLKILTLNDLLCTLKIFFNFVICGYFGVIKINCFALALTENFFQHETQMSLLPVAVQELQQDCVKLDTIQLLQCMVYL